MPASGEDIVPAEIFVVARGSAELFGVGLCSGVGVFGLELSDVNTWLLTFWKKRNWRVLGLKWLAGADRIYEKIESWMSCQSLALILD